MGIGNDIIQARGVRTIEDDGIAIAITKADRGGRARTGHFPRHILVEEADRAFAFRRHKIIAAKDHLERCQRIRLAVIIADLIPGDDQLIGRIELPVNQARIDAARIDIAEPGRDDRHVHAGRTRGDIGRNRSLERHIAIVVDVERRIGLPEKGEVEAEVDQRRRTVVIGLQRVRADRVGVIIAIRNQRALCNDGFCRLCHRCRQCGGRDQPKCIKFHQQSLFPTADQMRSFSDPEPSNFSAFTHERRLRTESAETLTFH